MSNMAQLSDVTRFLELTNDAKCLADLDRLLEDIALDMGFDFYALVQHVDIRRSDNHETIWLENYPDSWAEAFISTGLYANDPILVASQRTSAGFAWSDVGKLIKLNAHHRRVLDQAGREGMGDGFTVPAHVPGESNGTCNFAVKKGRTLPKDNLMMAQLVGTFAFEAGRKVTRLRNNLENRPPKLTQRQLDCLVFVSRGKTDWEIGQILGIKESTVGEYIEDACTRYDVRRRVQLVMRAVHDGHLTIRDTIG